MNLRSCAWLLVLLALAIGHAADTVVLGPGNVWRAFAQTAPATILPGVTPLPVFKDSQAWLIVLAPRSQPPAADWASADYDDQQWVMVNNVAHARAGAENIQSDAVYVRAAFGVDDPALVQGLTLAVQYRGGVVVYLNGKEVARQDVPDGAIDAHTMANPYPVAAFAVEAPPSAATTALRTRTATIAIPAAALRKGVNVVAVRNLRAPYRMEGLAVDDRFLVGRSLWPTVGLVSAQLTATAPDGLATPAHPAVRLWNAAAYEPVGREVTDAPAFAELRPVALQGPLGGSASGQVIASSDAALDGLTATAGALAGPAGATIPAKAVRIRYALPRDDNSRRFAPLSETAPAGAKLIPIWITVDIPADAKAGTYTGTVTLAGPTMATVSVRLQVAGWTLPDAKDWKSWSVTFQSPETLAQQYDVPLWSDAHFALIEQSMAYQARLGQRIALVHAIGSALFSRKSMVVYKQDGGKVVPDFTIVERYLTLYRKYMGRPEALMLLMFDGNVDERRRGLDPTAAIPVTMRDGDGFKDAMLPAYGQPGSDELWPTVVAGAKGVMRKLGWPEERLMLSVTADGATAPNDTAFFAKHFPDIPWITYTHGTTPTRPLKLGIMINPGQGGGHSSGHGWRTPRGFPNITNLRGHLEQQYDPINYRMAAMIALVEGCNGPGGIGLDYWDLSYQDERGRTRTTCVFQGGVDGNNWFRIIRGAPRTLLAPGPKGPIATAMYEQYLEGFQDAQALIYVDESAKDPRLPADLAARARETYDRIAAQGDLRNWRNGPGHGWYDEIGRLYGIAAEIQATLGK